MDITTPLFNVNLLELEDQEAAYEAEAYAPTRSRTGQTGLGGRPINRLHCEGTKSGPPHDLPIDSPDYINHPPHYNAHPSGVECITITEWMNFNLGNAMKYIWRANDKGATIEDLKKAQWYLAREIDRLGRL
jgi:hypothetical protein